MRLRVVLPAILLVAAAVAVPLLLMAENSGTEVGFTPQVFVVRSDGTGLRQVTSGGSLKYGPAWSSDARRLAYVDGALKVVTVASGKTRDLKGIPRSSGTAEVGWSPKRDELVYQFKSGTEDRPRWTVATVRPDGKGFRPLASWSGNIAQFGAPAWSPDGNRIVYVRQRERTDLSVVSRNRRRQRSFELPGNEYSPSWSPDGRSILFRRGDSDLWKISPSGRGLQRVGTGVKLAPETTWSPDGKQIAFAGHADGPDLQQHLYLLEVRSDAKPRKVVAEVNAAAWSPTAELIAFSDFNGRIAVTTPAGAQRTLATFPGDTDVEALSWSRNGRWLAFTAEKRRPD